MLDETAAEMVKEEACRQNEFLPGFNWQVQLLPKDDICYGTVRERHWLRLRDHKKVVKVPMLRQQPGSEFPSPGRVCGLD